MAASSRTASLAADHCATAVRSILQAGLFLVVLLPGIDEVQYFFTDHFFIAQWTGYLAPVFPNILGLDKDAVMLIVGAVQIVAAMLIVARPIVGGLVAAIGFWLIIVNLFLLGYYDILLRDFGLSMGSIALAVVSMSAARGKTRAARGSSTSAPTGARTETRTTEDVAARAGSDRSIA